MTKLSDIETKVEQTINSLDGMSSAEPKPFFYSRLHARMERELLTPRKVLGWQFKPVYAISAVACLLIINVFTILSFQKTQESNPERYNLYESGGF
jgi:hypothetical protein